MRSGGRPSFVVGPVNAEDLALIPGTDWIVATSMTDVSGRVGGLCLVNARDRSWRPLDVFGDTPRPGNSAYDAGLGEPDRKSFAPHGLGLRAGISGLHLLYVVAHGSRESIEILAIDARPAVPTVRWVGALAMPPRTSGNDVVALPDGGIAVTNMLDPCDAYAIAKMEAGKVTGNVLEWHAGIGWTVLAGSEMSGANGIEVSADGRWLYVGSWSSARCLLRLSRRGSPAERKTIDTGHLTDNLTWAADGTLLVTGHLADPIDFTDAYESATVLDTPFTILRFDPVSLESRLIVHDDGIGGFGAATVALEIAAELWVGTSRGDRIAIYPV